MPTKQTQALKQAPSQSPADELAEAPDDRPFEDGDARMQGTDIVAYIARGYQGVQVGAVLDDATEGLPELIDQDDLESQPFALLDVREQDKTRVVDELDDDGDRVQRRIAEYTMVIGAVQPIDFAPDGSVGEAGAIFIMVAGRPDSVLGREFRAQMGIATPSHPVMFPYGLHRIELGGGQGYYTTRKDAGVPKNKRLRPVLFPNRK